MNLFKLLSKETGHYVESISSPLFLAIQRLFLFLSKLLRLSAQECFLSEATHRWTRLRRRPVALGRVEGPHVSLLIRGKQFADSYRLRHDPSVKVSFVQKQTLCDQTYLDFPRLKTVLVQKLEDPLAFLSRWSSRALLRFYIGLHYCNSTY